MKNKIISIRIPNPCFQDWESMKPQDGKHFCEACQKSVVDFSNASLSEIISSLSDTDTKICGRFRKSQLDHLSYHLLQMPQQSNWKRYAGVLAITTGIFFQSCKEHMPEVMGKVEVSSKSLKEDRAQINQIYGYVFNNFNEPVVDCKISIEGTNLSAITDSAGKYQIQIDPSAMSQYRKLQVQGFEGMKTFAMNSSVEKQDTIKVEILETMTMGLVLPNIIEK